MHMLNSYVWLSLPHSARLTAIRTLSHSHTHTPDTPNIYIVWTHVCVQHQTQHTRPESPHRPDIRNQIEQCFVRVWCVCVCVYSMFTYVYESARTLRTRCSNVYSFALCLIFFPVSAAVRSSQFRSRHASADVWFCRTNSKTNPDRTPSFTATPSPRRNAKTLRFFSRPTAISDGLALSRGVWHNLPHVDMAHGRGFAFTERQPPTTNPACARAYITYNMLD